MTVPVSVPHLFAQSQGQDCAGVFGCYYCAAPCSPDYPVSEYVKDSFTGRDSVPCPGSLFVCAGCVLCLREACIVPLCDGVQRVMTKCAMRSWSWVITQSSAVAASKAHLEFLRLRCLCGARKWRRCEYWRGLALAIT